jgi:mRNA-degrading endonuclease toxin of MazEF toxin-antitoxin module
MKRGVVVWINLEDATPPELGKTRPGVIISNSEQNMLLDSVVAVPLSTQPPEIWPLRLKLNLAKQKASYAVLPGIRQVKKSRLLDVIDHAPAEFMRNLDRALAAYLSD